MNNQKTMTGKRKIDGINRILFLFMWVQLSDLTWADQRLGSLTPYGQGQKDTLIKIQDMGPANLSTDVHLDVPFKYTGKMYDTIHLIKNGLITLGGVHPEDSEPSSWDNVPQNLPLSTSAPLIAPYWTDPQVPQQGNLWFRQTMQPKELDAIKLKVECLYPQNKDLVAKWAFIATWEDISLQKDSSLTNTFQLVLVNIEDYSYVLFQYGNLTWSGGETSENGTIKSQMQDAVAGYNGGDGISYSKLPGSGSGDILKIQDNSNVDVPDLWIFRVDQSQEPCVMKGLALMLLLVVILTLLAGITIGLLLAWCCWKWKHKLNDYEDLDAETQKDVDPKTPILNFKGCIPCGYKILDPETREDLDLDPPYLNHKDRVPSDYEDLDAETPKDTDSDTPEKRSESPEDIDAETPVDADSDTPDPEKRSESPKDLDAHTPEDADSDTPDSEKRRESPKDLDTDTTEDADSDTPDPEKRSDSPKDIDALIPEDADSDTPDPEKRSESPKDIDADNPEDDDSDIPDTLTESTEEFTFVLDPAVSTISLTPLYTSNADVEPHVEPEDVPHRKITVIKHH